MARGRKRKNTEKARESNGGAELEAGGGVEAVKMQEEELEGVLGKQNDGKEMEENVAEEGVKRPGRRGRKKGQVYGKRESGAEEKGKGGSVYEFLVSVKERLRNRPKKMSYDESRDELDDGEGQVVAKKRGRKKRKVVQNQTPSAEKVDGEKKVLGRPRKKTNVANATEKVQNQDMVKPNRWDAKVSFVC